MNNNHYPLISKWVDKQLLKLFVLLATIILLFSQANIFYFINNGGNRINKSQIIPMKIVQEEQFVLGNALNDYLMQKEKEGLKVKSFSIDCDNLCSTTTSSDIEKSLKIEYELTVLSFNDKTFYFKNSEDCQSFISKITKYDKQDFNISQVDGKEHLITSSETLEDEVKNVIKVASIEKHKVSSRGGVDRRASSYSSGAPLAFYNYISSQFGARNGSHTGTDFASPGGTDIYAWKTGIVSFVGWKGSYGNFIIIDHGDGTVSRYAHCSGFNVSQGQPVTQGDVIGYVGTTGNSTGNHLHFEILINGRFVNPLNYI